MSVVGLNNHEDFSKNNSGGASSSIISRIKSLEEAGIKEATFIKKRIPPYAVIGNVIDDPSLLQISPNQQYYGATSTKIYQNPASPNSSQANQQNQQNHVDSSHVSPSLLITNVKTPPPANTVEKQVEEHSFVSAPYSRYFDQEILKKSNSCLNSLDINNNNNNNNNNQNSSEENKPPPVAISSFAAEIAKGLKTLKKTAAPQPKSEFQQFTDGHPSPSNPHPYQDREAPNDDENSSVQTIPISIPIKPFVHRDSIDHTTHTHMQPIHLDDQGDDTTDETPRAGSTSSSINSLNSSLNMPHDHQHKVAADYPFQNAIADKLKRHSGINQFAGNLAPQNDESPSYPFNRTLINTNSFAVDHIQNPSNKSSFSSRGSHPNQHYQHKPVEQFNNMTSNLSSPPSVEFIKNSMRSSFENLSEASTSHNNANNNNNNHPSQLVSGF